MEGMSLENYILIAAILLVDGRSFGENTDKPDDRFKFVEAKLELISAGDFILIFPNRHQTAKAGIPVEELLR